MGSDNGDGRQDAAVLEATLDPPERPETMLELLRSIDGRLAALEATVAGMLDEYRPLLDMVKARADRGTWRGRFANGGNAQ